jgi:hypothetical protein
MLKRMCLVAFVVYGLTDGQDDPSGNDTRNYSHPFLHCESSAAIRQDCQDLIYHLQEGRLHVQEGRTGALARVHHTCRCPGACASEVCVRAYQLDRAYRKYRNTTCC